MHLACLADGFRATADGRMPKAAYHRSVSKPVVAVGLLAVMGGAWYWALLPSAPAAVSRRPVSPVVAGSPSPAVPSVRLADLAAEAASRPMPGGGRNPFAIGLPVATADDSHAGRRAPAAPLATSSPRPAPVWPHLDLIGLAEARDGGGLVRTAIVSGPHGVYHARAGELVEQVYRVERIGGDGVDIRLLPEDRMLRLALRP